MTKPKAINRKKLVAFVLPLSERRSCYERRIGKAETQTVCCGAQADRSQAFSIIGKKEGFADEARGTLFFEIERILKEKKKNACIHA